MSIDQNFIAILRSGEPIPSSQESKTALQTFGLDFEESNATLVVTPPLELLDESLILRALQPSLSKLYLHEDIDSTNTFLMSKIDDQDFHGAICLAEYQSAGRGRRGKKWISPYGRNIYLSMGWKVPKKIGVDGLSLIVGMQITKSLRELGLTEVGLKWPNDVLIDEGKLAGILIEVGASSIDGISVVIGVGINMAMNESDGREIDQAYSQIGDYLSVSRNELVTSLITNLHGSLALFSKEGFSHLMSEWDAYNLYRDKPVSVLMGENLIKGIDRGVNNQGHLLLETAAGLESYNAGEVSLRRN